MNAFSQTDTIGRALDIEMSAKAFSDIARIAHEKAGLVISQTKMSMVKSRLARRLRGLQMQSYEEYLTFVQSGAGADELEKLISALTTNVSHFFREQHHFDQLQKTILPMLLERAASGLKIRIWSAGCSNGQEPYSIAMTLMDACPDIARRDFRILATDIDPEVLATARNGLYVGALTTGLEDRHIDKYFDRVNTEEGPGFKARDILKEMVSFNQLNLHANWPMTGKFDVIFCRNVVIYFDETNQTALYRKFAEILQPTGTLFLGHSERVGEAVAPLFKTAGVTAYNLAGN